ncbi:uncharacterized protein LOC126785937 isoform X3 [Argentina anserina]|uniref:uncharacterized protein LOC126785937 isoform X3 n=1 Tax=Argentina anserina TaxID=57926 RepID=UPI0021762D7B|nr:uncharacterized protein LOC126785937 isoform X3 [Potentilla anserina]
MSLITFCSPPEIRKSTGDLMKVFLTDFDILIYLHGTDGRGAVRFYPKGPSSCIVELTVSYEVPAILAPVASALQPFTESLLARGLERCDLY